jgi:hypothetical protein
MTARLSRSPGRPTRKFAVLINSKGAEATGRAHSMPYQVFEDAILSRLEEIDPHEILNGDHAPDETAPLAAELAQVDAELSEAAAFMDANGFSPTIGKRVAALEARKCDVAAQLLEARARAVHPASESWGEAQTLMQALASAPDPQEARLRLRSILRRLVEDMRVLIVRQRQECLIAVQIWFAGGKRHRDYLILHRQASGKRPQQVKAWSLADIAKVGKLDLRRPDHARRLEKVLAEMNLQILDPRP